MIRNYIKTAFRSLTKNKGFTAINVLGLALGLATCLLIVCYVVDELSYDNYNVKAERIYRVNNDIKFGGNTKSYATAAAIFGTSVKSNFPQVEQVVRFLDRGGANVKKDDQDIYEEKMIYADPSIFDVFTLPMTSGNPATALTEPHTIVINERTAEKYFKSTNVIGQVLTFNDTAQYKITGVIKDIPSQSHFNFDFFISISTLAESRGNSWFANNFNTYLLLKPGADYKKLEARFPEFVRKNASGQLLNMFNLTFDKLEKSGNYFNFSLTPLKQIHLQSNRIAELGINSNIQYIYVFSAIAIFILLIAAVNFMNLSTARSANRAREVGVRKVLGSSRTSLMVQFITESIILTFFATLIAVFLAWALLPLFNQVSGKQLMVTSQLLIWMIPALLVIVMVIGVLAGSYPAFFLSAFRPVNVLKGKISGGFKGVRLRSFLVVFQFSISIFLIIGTLVIYNQLKFIQSKDVGYDRDQVLIVRNGRFLGDQAKTFKQEIKKLPGVKNATLSTFLPTALARESTVIFKDPIQKQALSTQFWEVDEDYLNTLGMKLASGRNFSDQMLTDSSAVIINEAAAKLLGFSNPLNENIYEGKTPYHIIGVIKDFNFESLRNNVSPLMLRLAANRGKVAVRISTANIPFLLSQIGEKWKQLTPGHPFTYSFMDQDFNNIYNTEQRIGKIFISFSTLAILIACLGLFGLAAYAAEQRTKEIGIRKVLGATVANITAMLSKDFLMLVMLSIIIASPIAWYAMNKWLQDYANRINIGWPVFVFAGSIAVVIAFITISFQSIKAALANPVKSLRSE
jgi:putative ABC transport system permease protein